MNLWIDDLRDPPDKTWIVARTYKEAIAFIDTIIWTLISLDHDLGEEKTGYDVLCHIEEKAYMGTLGYSPSIKIHSANTVGAERMRQAATKIEGFLDKPI